MRVGLNATCFDNRPSGANQRFKHIYGALIRSQPQTEFVIYEPLDVPIAQWFEGAPNVVARRTPVPSIGRLARARAGLRFWQRALKADKLDLFEAFHLPLVTAPDCPTIFTIHDLRPILPSEPALKRMVASAVLHHGFSQATRVIAVSDVIRQEILAFHPGAEVTTIHNGVDVNSFREGVSSALSLDFRSPGQFLLTVGHLEARKNLVMLVDALAILRDRGIIRPLVIVGNDAGERAHIEARIAQRDMGDQITLVSHADDVTVRALYAACHLVVFPSRYEGFGIPAIEAMAARRPLVLSDISAFKEIMCGQGAFFSPDDPVAAADQIDRMWRNEADRERMIAFGDARVQDFTFNKLAGEVAAVHRALLNDR